MKYFAFGSNMNLGQMRVRCPGSKFLGVGILEGYRLVYDGESARWSGAVGNVIPSSSECVYGSIFEIDDDDLKALDEYEGFPTRYQKMDVTAKPRYGKSVTVMTYFRTDEKEGLPSRSYMDGVVEGARECGLPEEYIKEYLIKQA